MKHDRKSALETTVGDLRDALAGIAASVNAEVPSKRGVITGRGRVVTEWNGIGWCAVREDYGLGMPVGISFTSEANAIQDLLDAEGARHDDEDAEEDEPTEIPLTAEQQRTEYWIERHVEDMGAREEEDE